MPNTQTYNSTDTPIAIPTGATLSDNIVIPGGHQPSDTLVNLSVNVQITAPDEGYGTDYSLLGVTLVENFSTGAEQAVLQTGLVNSLSNFSFPDNGSPLQSFAVFQGLPCNNTWTLKILNVSQIAAGTLTAWSITATYPDKANTNVPGFPGAPNLRAIPANLKYGKGGNVKLNNKLYFNFPGIVYPVKLIDNVKASNITGFIRDLRVSAVNSGSASNLVLSLHKVSGGVDTVLAPSTLVLNPGLTFTSVMFPTYDATLYPIKKGDLVYLTVDSVGSNVSNLSVALTLNVN